MNAQDRLARIEASIERLEATLARIERKEQIVIEVGREEAELITDLAGNQTPRPFNGDGVL